MNKEQFKALTRETVTALSALVYTLGIGNDQILADVSALVIAGAMLIWGLLDKSSKTVPSLARKAMQAVSPVLVSFNVLTPDQGVATTSVLLALVGIWTSLEKK